MGHCDQTLDNCGGTKDHCGGAKNRMVNTGDHHAVTVGNFLGTVGHSDQTGEDFNGTVDQCVLTADILMGQWQIVMECWRTVMGWEQWDEQYSIRKGE